MALSDRRRVNGPSTEACPLVFNSPPFSKRARIRESQELRKLCECTRSPQSPNPNRTCRALTILVLKTGLVSSASGSAYLEVEQNAIPNGLTEVVLTAAPMLKILCAVHGPRPLPKSASFSPLLKLSTSVRFASSIPGLYISSPATLQERDLSAHLEAALRGLIIADRWPKSGLEVVITILEVESHDLSPSHDQELADISILLILSGCITAASAAIVDAGIDCLDLVTGGVAALVEQVRAESKNSTPSCDIVSDPSSWESKGIITACVVGYSQCRDEVTELWIKSNTSRIAGSETGSRPIDALIDQAVEAAKSARLVLVECLQEASSFKSKQIGNGEVSSAP